MKTFKFSLVLHTRENTDVFITLDDNIYGIHSKRVNILYIFSSQFLHSFVKGGCSIYFFLNFANLICRGTDISNTFRESLGLRDNKSWLCIE